MEADIVIESQGFYHNKHNSGCYQKSKKICLFSKGDTVISNQSHNSGSQGWNLVSDKSDKENHTTCYENEAEPSREKLKQKHEENDQNSDIKTANRNNMWKTRVFKVRGDSFWESFPISYEESTKKGGRIRRIDTFKAIRKPVMDRQEGILINIRGMIYLLGVCQWNSSENIA